MLINEGADINIPNKDGIYPVHYAAAARYPRLLTTLLMHGADLNVKDKRGRQIAHYLAQNCTIMFSKEYENERFPGWDSMDNDGKYPMHYLGEYAHLATKYGQWDFSFDKSQIFKKDNFGKYPMDYMNECMEKNGNVCDEVYDCLYISVDETDSVEKEEEYEREESKEYLFNKISNIEPRSVSGALFGVAIGDALGIPYHLKSRNEMEQSPATYLVEDDPFSGFGKSSRFLASYLVPNGSHSGPTGHWSYKSGLTFYLAESLASGYSLKDIATKLSIWSSSDITMELTTELGLKRLEKIIAADSFEELPMQKYYSFELENGSGSLMRILPLLFYIDGMDIKKQFDIVFEVSALTHRNIIAAMSCFIYLKFAENLLHGKSKDDSYSRMREDISNFWDNIYFYSKERKRFSRLIQNDIRDTPQDDLKTGTYVVDMLESSFWMFLNNSSYGDTVLSIINLGGNTSISAAIVGGLAGLHYGVKGIPHLWVHNIDELWNIDRFSSELTRSLNG